jgi:glycosyltransferase involved in cell wall biosynthesis
MTIVYCIFSLADPGGMQRVLTVKANYLADVSGHVVYVVTRDGAGVQPVFALSPRVRVITMGRDYERSLTAFLYTVRPDIAVSLYGEESRFLYKIGDGSKKILEFHFTRNHLVHLVKGLPQVRFRRLRLYYARLLQYLDERWAPHYDRLVLLTEADRVLWGYPANAVVIPNPLSFTSAIAAPLEATRILSAGRLIATKGFDLLIDAFRLAADWHPDWTLAIFGEGQDREYLQNRIEVAGLSGQAEIHPPTPDLAGELLRSSIYAAASRYEGFGLVLTEAMECGVPCVAFDCECGPGEIIRNGYDGKLVPPLDVKQFGEALLRLIESPKQRKQLGQNARSSARRYAADKIMGQWETIFHSLVANTTADVR